MIERIHRGHLTLDTNLPLTLKVVTYIGAFVAGLDAGHAYNTFPLMGGHLVPEEYWSIPGWRNIFENTAAVQFHHRLLALTTLTSVASTWLVHRRAKLPSGSRGLLHALVAVTALQVSNPNAIRFFPKWPHNTVQAVV